MIRVLPLDCTLCICPSSPDYGDYRIERQMGKAREKVRKHYKYNIVDARFFDHCCNFPETKKLKNCQRPKKMQEMPRNKMIGF